MKFITFEGIEGCGKSTQSKKLHQYLAQNNEVILTREPGGCSEAEKIREILVNENLEGISEVLLNFAARLEHVNKVIKPALDSGKFVISDRFFDSTYAYQGGGFGLDDKIIDQIKDVTISSFAPDITFFIDIEVEKAFARINGRDGNNKYEELELDFHQRVREKFLNLAKKNSRIKIINGDQEIDEIFNDIIGYLK